MFEGGSLHRDFGGMAPKPYCIYGFTRRYGETSPSHLQPRTPIGLHGDHALRWAALGSFE